jgi:hypothetical protein
MLIPTWVIAVQSRLISGSQCELEHAMHSHDPRRGVVGSTYPALQWGNKPGY